MSKKCGEYAVGDTISGTKIAKIIGQDTNVVVCTNGNGTIVYSIEDETSIRDYEKKSLELKKLLESLPRDGNKSVLKRIKEEIGYTFFTACTCNEGISTNAHFSGTNEKINELNKHTGELRYKKLVFWNIFQTAIVCGILAIIYSQSEQEIKGLSFYMVGGALGASLSLLQRNNKLNLTSFTTIWDIQLSAFLSVCLGVIAGFVVYWFTKSGFVPEGIAQDSAALFLLSILAGSSERFFNALMNKVK